MSVWGTADHAQYVKQICMPKPCNLSNTAVHKQ